MFKITKKKVAGIVLTSGLAISGVAFAAWTADGTGTGSADAIEAQSLGVTPATTADLYPGNTVDLELTVTNDNPYDVQLTDVSLDALGITSDEVDCDANSVTFDGTDFVDTVVPAGSLGTAVTVPDGLTMANATADDDCQGATFTINVDVLGASYVAAP